MGIFMILGGNYGQLKGIQTVKRLGMKVLVVDRNPNAVGIKEADIFEQADLTDKEKILEIAKKYNIKGVLTMSSDIGVPAACYVNEQLHLLDHGLRNLNILDKSCMRSVFAKAGVSIPNFYLYRKGDNIHLLYSKIEKDIKNHQFIIKPTDRSGTQGVKKISHISELEDAVQHALEFSNNNKIIAEEFIDGEHIAAQCLSSNGKLVYCFVGNQKITKNLIPIGNVYPSNLSKEKEEEVKNKCSQILTNIGLKNGPTNFEMIIDKNGEIYAIEINPRIPSDQYPELLKLHSGIDEIELSIKQACGQHITIPQQLKNIPTAVETLYFNRNGKVKEIKCYEDLLEKYQPNDYSVLIKPEQDISHKLPGIAYGHVIFTGKSSDHAKELCNDFLNKLREKVIFK